MPSSPDQVLTAVGLSRTFDGTTAIFADVNLTLYEGEFVSLLGLSGSGKTTLFHLLAALDTPDTGVVQVKRKVGYMLQKDLLLPWKRLIDNVSLPLRLAGMKPAEARAKARALLPQFGLEGLDRRRPAALSGGQRQRAALLRTYLYGGTIVLLDEPFAGVDAITRKALYAWLTTIRKSYGLTILLITHDLDEAVTLSDRIYVLSAERPARLSAPIVVASDSRDSVMARLMRALYQGRHDDVDD